MHAHDLAHCDGDFKGVYDLRIKRFRFFWGNDPLNPKIIEAIYVPRLSSTVGETLLEKLEEELAMVQEPCQNS